MIRSSSRLVASGLLSLLLLLVAWEPAAGQRAPSFGGVELRFGLVLPEAAEVGTGLTAEVDLGYLLVPSFRLLAGFSRFVADIDREPGGDEGSYVAQGGWVGGRFDFMPLRRVSPYAKAAVTVQGVSADAFDPDIGRLLDGVNVGMGAAIGARYQVGGAGSVQATTELRRTFMNNIGNTALEIGVRWQRRGAAAYFDQGRPIAVQPVTTPAPVPVAPPAAEPAPPIAPGGPEAPTPAPAEESALPPAAPITPPPSMAPSAAPGARAAAEAMLRQGTRRAASSMRSVSGFDETAVDFIVTIGGGAFPSGSAEPMAEARRELRLLATVLAGYPGHIVLVEGHTDSSGDAALNRRLAGDRASAIRAGLIAEGVDPLWVAAISYGQDRPVATNETADGRTRNRRVDIRISKQGCGEPPLATTDGGLTCAF